MKLMRFFPVKVSRPYFGGHALIIGLVMLFSCSERELNEIDTNPNAPADVPVRELIPAVTVGTPYYVNGSELAWYSAVFSEQMAGTYLDMRSADRRTNINSQLAENGWKLIYTNVLQNLQTIIDKGSAGGAEAGNWKYVGIAQVLFAYTMTTVTDLWGSVPYSEALDAENKIKPKYDSQQSIYLAMQKMLDEAIQNLRKESIDTPGAEDLIYGGDTELWVKAAWGLKARMYNRLSNTDPTGTANDALDCIDSSFQSTNENMFFDFWGGTDDADHQNPWYRQQVERGQFSVSKTLYDMMNDMQDPRVSIFFTAAGSDFVPAQNGSADEDATGLNFSKPSNEVIYENAPLPMLTYAEIKFIEAECESRLGNISLANFAYEKAVMAAVEKAGVSSSDAIKYYQRDEVFPGDDLEQHHIIKQKYIALWPYGSVEAYSEWRRTGYPELTNPLGEPPLRFPYPQNELTTNAENVPDVQLTNGVWWDDSDD